MGQTIVIAGPERRRRWSDEQKGALLAEAFSPGGSVADVARRADICTSLLYRWRQLQSTQRRAPGFVPAVMMDGPLAAAASPAVISATLGALR